MPIYTLHKAEEKYNHFPKIEEIMRTKYSLLLALFLLTGLLLFITWYQIEKPIFSIDKMTQVDDAKEINNQPPQRELDSKNSHIQSAQQDEVARNMAIINQMRRRDHEGLVVEQRPDGSKYVDLQGRFGHVIMARIDENGQLIIYEE